MRVVANPASDGKPRGQAIAPPSVVDGLVQEARRAEFRVEIEAFLITSETPVEGLEAGAEPATGYAYGVSFGVAQIVVRGFACRLLPTGFAPYRSVIVRSSP